MARLLLPGTETLLRKPCHDLLGPTYCTHIERCIYIYTGELRRHDSEGLTVLYQVMASARGLLTLARFVTWRDGSADPTWHANGDANNCTIISIRLGVRDGEDAFRGRY